MTTIQKIIKSNFTLLLPVLSGISYITDIKAIKIVCIILIALIIFSIIYKWLVFGIEVKNDKLSNPKVKKVFLKFIISVIVLVAIISYFIFVAWKENL